VLRHTTPKISTWKQEKYIHGDPVTVDASPFLN